MADPKGVHSLHLSMENYEDIWDRQIICGLSMMSLHLEDGKVVLRVHVKNDLNYRDSIDDWRVCHVLPSDLHGFLAGLSVLPEGIGNGVDCELELQIRNDQGFVPVLLDDHLQELHSHYVIPNDDGDGGFTDPELEEINRRFIRNEETWVDLTTHKLLSTKRYILGMNIEGFSFLFKRRPPLSFIQGLELFQTLSHSCETRLAKLPRKCEDRLSKEKK